MSKKSKTQSYTHELAMEMLEERRKSLTCHMVMIRPLAGGQPATQKGVEAFVEHQLCLDPDSEEFEAAVARILKEEIGERDTTPEEGEVKEVTTYGINVIRRSKHGPYILEHQIKALLKQAASRLRLFVTKRGSKGNLAEMGTIEATGDSLQNPERPWEIYLRKNGGPAPTSYDRINGRVRTPQGAKSIQHDTEVCEEGAEFWFSLSYLSGHGKTALEDDDMIRMIAATCVIGLGSCLSLGYGRMRIAELELC